MHPLPPHHSNTTPQITRHQESSSFTTLSASMFALGVFLTVVGVFVLSRIDSSVQPADDAIDSQKSFASSSVAAGTDTPTATGSKQQQQQQQQQQQHAGTNVDDGGESGLASGPPAYSPPPLHPPPDSDTVGVGRYGAGGTTLTGSSNQPLSIALLQGDSRLNANLGQPHQQRARRGRRGRRGGRRYSLQPTAFMGSFPGRARRRYSVAVLGVGVC